MSRTLITNALSLNMIGDSDKVTLDVRRLNRDTVSKWLRNGEYPIGDEGVDSAIGHKELAAVVSADLGVEVPYNRVSVNMEDYDFILVAQYSGPRLEEGATALSAGATIIYYGVIVYPGGA